VSVLVEVVIPCLLALMSVEPLLLLLHPCDHGIPCFLPPPHPSSASSQCAVSSLLFSHTYHTSDGVYLMLCHTTHNQATK
jgi:hypothetical protein